MVKRVVVYIGLGSNIGPGKRHISRALSALASLPSYRLTSVSSFYATTPVGPRQRNFVNAVARCVTARGPYEVLSDLKSLERRLGRRTGRRWGPRIIDLDILFYGSRVIRTPRLAVPHPRIPERRFVLEPLAQIVPGLRHPLLHRTAGKLRDRARLTCRDQKVTIYPDRSRPAIASNGRGRKDRK